MKAQKHKKPAPVQGTIVTFPDSDTSGSESDDSESDDTANHHVVKKPQYRQSEDEDDSSDSESDGVIKPSETVTKAPKDRKTVTKVPEKVSTLKRSRRDDGGPDENARPSKRITKESETHILHESYTESSGDCTILAGQTYFKVFRLTFLKV